MRNSRSRRTAGGARATITLLLLALACPGLTACGGSSGQSPAAAAIAAQNAKIYKSQHAEALELVSCAHRHGIPLPPPNPTNNNISTVGVNLKIHHRQAELSNCYHRVIQKAAKAQAAEREAEEAARKRRGEPPPREAGPSSATLARERQQLTEVVSCARHHGLNLPEPDAHNNINPRGLNLESPHNKTIMNACFRNAVAKASSEQQEQEHEREAGPRRLGEEPTG
jgi:hypothetical protein